MVCVRSMMVLTWIDGGIAASSRGSACLIRSTVSMTLAPGCLKMISRMPRLPFCQAASSRFSGPSIARPISLTRTARRCGTPGRRCCIPLHVVSWSLL